MREQSATRPLPELIFRSAGIAALAYRRHVHPAISPTPRLRVKTVLLFRSIPFSNSVDRKFHAPLCGITGEIKIAMMRSDSARV